MTLGSPGATRIIPTLAQVISNVVDRGMPIQIAIGAPRLFQGRTGNLSMEGRYSINAYNDLVALGHAVTVSPTSTRPSAASTPCYSTTRPASSTAAQTRVATGRPRDTEN